MRLRNLCAVVTSFGIALAGCGGSSDSGTTPPPPPPAKAEQNFDSVALDTPFDVQGWEVPKDITAVVAADPIVSTNKVLKIVSGNYNAGVWIKLTLPAGKTVADYASFDYRAYFQAGDLTEKDLVVFISDAVPAINNGKAFDTDPTLAAGKIHRAGGTDGISTEWESISIPLDNLDQTAEALSGDVYFGFGSNNSGSTYYVDDIKLVAK